jgi:CHAD domain-containing protein
VSAIAGPTADRLSAATVLRTLLDAQVTAVQAAGGRLRTNGVSGVHEMRVELRRLRSTLKAFEPFFDDSIDGLRTELRWFSSELSPARDAEVLTIRLTAACADDGRLGAQALAVLQPLLSVSQEAGVLRAQQAWGSERYAELAAGLGQLFASRLITLDPDAAAEDVFPALLARELSSLRRRADLLGGAGDRDEQFHELRKATKQARYVSEVLLALKPKQAARLGRALQRLQTLLGDRQDNAVARRYLHDLLQDGDLDEHATIVVAHLLDHDNAATARLEEGLPKALRKVARRAEWLPEA